MSCPVKRVRSLGVASVAAFGLSACAVDPAFLEGLAMATESLAAETAQMAEDSRCYRHLSTSGEWVTLCPLPAGQFVPPAYTPPSPYKRYRNHDRDPQRNRPPGGPRR